MLNLRSISSIVDIEQLESLLSEPSEAVIESMRRLDGDIILLGAAGKIGRSLARMAKQASDRAGSRRRIIAVSRFSDLEDAARLEARGIEAMRCDLLDEAAAERLPDAPNVVFLAGLKFGSSDQAAKTWATNTYLPGIVSRKFSSSRIVAFSTGGVYGLTPVAAGAVETDAPAPVGEYAASCLGRERIFEYFSQKNHTPVAMLRLFYACELRYGILVDLAWKVARGERIDLGMGHFNTIWQGDSNAMTLLAFEQTASPPCTLNITGPEILDIREIAERMGTALNRTPRFEGSPLGTACLGNASESHRLFGPPQVGAEQLVDWVVDWVRRGGENLGKPTHFEVRDGRY